MNKSIIRLISLAVVSLLVSTITYAQPKLFSKKHDLKDIGEKTLMVVTDNSSFLNMTIKESATKLWDLSKVDFCDMDEFDKIKTDSSYYFLVRLNGKFKKEDDPGIEFLSLLKGGTEALVGTESMYDVLSLPLKPVDGSGDYILPFVDTYIKIFKAHVKRVQENKIVANTMGLSFYANRLSKIGKKIVFINEEDMSEMVTADYINASFKDNGKVVDEDTIEESLEKARPGLLVSICIAPEEPKDNGSYCYKMLVGADDGDLYYFRKQKINAKNPKGFLPEDIKKISIPFIF